MGWTLTIDPPAVPFDAAAFYHLFGDQFVTSVTSGIEYYAVYAYDCQTQEEKNQLLASFEAHGISTSGDVTVSLTTDIASVATSSNTQFSFVTNMNKLAPISITATARGASASTLRRLHNSGQLKPARTEGGQRRYDSLSCGQVCLIAG